jgi:cell division protein FtsZ
MGTGEAEGDRRAIEAAEAAIANPLLEDLSMKTARGLLINITGSLDMTLMEVDEAVNRILEEVDSEADMIFGSTFDDSLEGRIRISVVATGIEVGEQGQIRPAPIIQPRPVLAPESAAGTKPAGEPVPASAAAAAGEPNGAESGAVLTLLDEAGGPAAAGSAEQAPMGMPALDNDAFIPPAPVHAEETTAPADPFAEAAFENGADGGKRRKPSLFERVAEAAGVVSGERRAQMTERFEPITAPAAAAPPKQRPPAADRGQPRLGGLEPGRGAGATDAEGEMLDIPAFLRRQAN